MKCIFSYTSTIECEIYQTCIMCCFSIMHMHMLLLLKNGRTHLVPRHTILPRPWLHGPLQSPASMAQKHVVLRAVIIPPHKRKVTPFKGEQHPQLCVPRLGPLSLNTNVVKPWLSCMHKRSDWWSKRQHHWSLIHGNQTYQEMPLSGSPWNSLVERATCSTSASALKGTSAAKAAFLCVFSMSNLFRSLPRHSLSSFGMSCTYEMYWEASFNGSS